MLTKQDLLAIKNLVEEIVDEKVEESTLETGKNIFMLKVEMKKEFSRVHKDQNSIIKFFNQEYLDLRTRVERLEEHLNLPPHYLRYPLSNFSI